MQGCRQRYLLHRDRHVRSSVSYLVGSNKTRCLSCTMFVSCLTIQLYSSPSANVLQQLDKQFTELDDALNAFVEEMKAQGKWDDVTIVVSSDFGR